MPGFDPGSFWLWAKHASAAPRRDWAFLHPAQDQSSNRDRTYVQWFYWPPAIPLAYRAKKMCHLWDSNPCGLLRPKDLKSSPLDQLGQVSAKYLIEFSICNLFYLWELASSWQIKLRTTWFEQVTNRSTVDRSTNWAMSGRTRPNLLLEARRFYIGTNPRFHVSQRESNPRPLINSDKIYLL